MFQYDLICWTQFKDTVPWAQGHLLKIFKKWRNKSHCHLSSRKKVKWMDIKLKKRGEGESSSFLLAHMQSRKRLLTRKDKSLPESKANWPNIHPILVGHILSWTCREDHCKGLAFSYGTPYLSHWRTMKQASNGRIADIRRGNLSGIWFPGHKTTEKVNVSTLNSA